MEMRRLLRNHGIWDWYEKHNEGGDSKQLDVRFSVSYAWVLMDMRKDYIITGSWIGMTNIYI